MRYQEQALKPNQAGVDEKATDADMIDNRRSNTPSNSIVCLLPFDHNGSANRSLQ